MDHQIEKIKQALALQDFDVRSAQAKLAPLGRPLERPADRSGQARVGGVLLLLFCHNQAWYVTLTRRRADLKAHGGQISFPGGRNEPAETLLTTALRETEEEIGIRAAQIEVLGELAPIYIPPSDFEVHPFVGWIKNGRRPLFSPEVAEVDEVLEVPLSQLQNPANFQREPRSVLGRELNIPFFDVNREKVWGGTAVILNEFLERLQAVDALVSDRF